MSRTGTENECENGDNFEIKEKMQRTWFEEICSFLFSRVKGVIEMEGGKMKGFRFLYCM